MKYCTFMDSILDHTCILKKYNNKKTKTKLTWNWWVGAQQTKNILRMAPITADKNFFFQAKSTNILFIVFLHKNLCWGHSLEAPWQYTSYE